MSKTAFGRCLHTIAPAICKQQRREPDERRLYYYKGIEIAANIRDKYAVPISGAHETAVGPEKIEQTITPAGWKQKLLSWLSNRTITVTGLEEGKFTVVLAPENWTERSGTIIFIVEHISQGQKNIEIDHLTFTAHTNKYNRLTFSGAMRLIGHVIDLYVAA